MIRWEGAFFEAVEDESILEGDIHVIPYRTMKVKLGLGLIAKCESLRLELIDITRYFHRLAGLNWTVIPFLSEQRS